MNSSHLLLATLLLLSPVRDPHPFGPGSYRLVARSENVTNPYEGTQLHFLEGGDLLWTRETQAIATMHWSLQGDLLTIEDADGCPLGPIGLYRVTWQGPGFVTDQIADACGDRASTAARVMLVPIDPGS